MEKTINSRIKKIREHFCKNSNKEFAKLLGETPQTVNNWVRSEYSVGKSVVNKLARVFPNVSLGWLLTGEGEMLKPSNNSIVQQSIVGDNNQQAGGGIRNSNAENRQDIISELKQQNSDLKRQVDNKDTLISKLMKQNEQLLNALLAKQNE